VPLDSAGILDGGRSVTEWCGPEVVVGAVVLTRSLSSTRMRLLDEEVVIDPELALSRSSY
jgi:hypothetical protein